MEILLLFIATILVAVLAGLISGIRKMLPIIRNQARFEAFKRTQTAKQARSNAAFDAELREQGWL